MVGVPAIWETIRKGIVSKVHAGGALKTKVFNLAMSAKKLGGNGSFLGNLADSVVFKNVKSATGGKLKYALNGGAPIVSFDPSPFLRFSRSTRRVLTDCNLLEISRRVWLLMNSSSMLS